jgi:Fe-S oxidoreductase
VSVDVATYKAEFLSHYYEGRLRPLNAYAFGNIDFWAGLASNAPGLVNLTTQLPFLSDIVKFLGHIPPQRRIPAFAPETFKQWFFRTNGTATSSRTITSPWKSGASAPRYAQPDGGALAPDFVAPAVLLWADTFNNHFLPSTAKAAAEVLEAAGFDVMVPRAHLCCGRPLYDVGMLDRAKSLLLQIMDELLPEIEAGTPIVVLEPSCATVFRDELINLFPKDQRARALSKQVFLLSEFLEQHAKNFPIPKLARKALIHGHCHHKAIMKMTL